MANQEASTKNVETQIGQFSKLVTTYYNSQSFVGSIDNPKNETCKAIELRSSIVIVEIVEEEKMRMRCKSKDESKKKSKGKLIKGVSSAPVLIWKEKAQQSMFVVEMSPPTMHK
ncbi:hypothetical protein TSUD_162390 [Trifolium subterraneum]|uniref:Uncharacterized protein n=1 Tax=Trifolium subterraneum TaxID=3900 RepID=A0A2Z6MT72_TRISU|nr:hypothetical protein TSUD_162390 [Trifolium subterraneum]